VRLRVGGRRRQPGGLAAPPRARRRYRHRRVATRMRRAGRAEMIEQPRRQVPHTQVRGCFRCAVAGRHGDGRKCKPKTTGHTAANSRIHGGAAPRRGGGVGGWGRDS
jgi:hypothetical protein